MLQSKYAIISGHVVISERNLADVTKYVINRTLFWNQYDSRKLNDCIKTPSRD